MSGSARNLFVGRLGLCGVHKDRNLVGTLYRWDGLTVSCPEVPRYNGAACPTPIEGSSVFMPKLVTVKRLEGNTQKARDYIKAYILFPSGALGLVCMIAGTASLGYQLLATDTYTWATFSESTGLLVMGGILGWIQTRYHQYLLREYPEVFASRMRKTAKTTSRAKKEIATIASPPGQAWVPAVYVVGLAILLSASAASTLFGHVYFMAALLMPWAGFFWAKLFFWRSILRERP